MILSESSMRSVPWTSELDEIERAERECDSYRTFGLARVDEVAIFRSAQQFTCDYWRREFAEFINERGGRLSERAFCEWWD